MSRMFGRMTGGLFALRFASVALTLLLGAKELRASGLLDNVPEATGYTLVYEFPIPVNSPGWASNLSTNPYSFNIADTIATGSFARVAYYLEAVKTTGETQWVYVSMSAYTTNATQLGIPRNYVVRYGLYDTAAPSNATVRSNVSGITTGDNIDTINLEFWPSNYGGSNSHGVPNASASTFDFGDDGETSGAGHGSMQIHNYGAGETLFAYNNWGTSQSACAFGFGNQPSGNPDWTFNTANISTFSSRTLQVLILSNLGLETLGATNVTTTSGYMNGRVTCFGAAGDVWAYWGGSDQTTNSALWANGAIIGSYTNGIFDVTYPATGLSGGATNWYNFLFSNDVDSVWATASTNFVAATSPAVDNSLGALVATGQAELRGTLTAGGTSDIYVYWGLTDGGQTTNYDHVIKLTDVRQGDFATSINAYCGFSFHYICFASNAADVAWAPASSTFLLPAAGGALAYANGLRGSVFQTTADSQTPVDLSGAAYTESLTRVPTGTKANTVLAMAEVAGKNIVLTGPANSWNEFGGTPGDHFVVALSGRFCPPVSGAYTFRWSQDDRGWMFMDTGNDGVFDSGDAVGYWLWNSTATLTLTAGESYPFMFFSQEFGGGDNLAFWYTPPGGNEVYVCPSAQLGQWKYPSQAIPDIAVGNTQVESGSLTDHSATLQGTLYGREWLLDVYACWGRSDGGNIPGNWETNAFVGRFSNWDGALSLPVDGLAAGETYYYTFFVTNEMTSAWASPAQSFMTGEVSVEATDGSASESGDAGTFRVTRPVTATNGALTVSYTLSGTAANGVDYATLSGSVTIPEGASGADVSVSPVADSVWSEGDETVTLTLAAGNYTVGTPSLAVVTIHDAAITADDWSLRLPIHFTGYSRTEALANFPALVKLDASISGFSYDQFLSGANGDLRFVDDSMTQELPYEIERWNPDGTSFVWVQVPVLTNNATVWMLWRKSGQSAPAYTTNGAVWANGYVMVAHQSEDALGTAYDSTSFGNHGAQSGVIIQNVSGIVAGGDQFDGLDDYMTFGKNGRPTNTFSFSSWIQASQAHQIDTESNSGTGGTSGQKYAFEAEYQADYAGAGLSVGTNGLSVYEHASSYMPPLAVYAGNLGTGWNHVMVTYSNKTPRIYLNGQLVRTGITSTRLAIFAPYRICGNNYGYFGGLMDETRVSAVTRSDDWIWAEYMNVASNDVLATFGVSQTPERPEIANQPASGVSGTAATLNGYLVSTGMAETAVAVYWGPADGGADAGAWANTNWFDAPAAVGAFAKDISGLSSGTNYFFRFAASNAYGVVWAPATETLLTGAVTLQASDASAAEYPLNTGAITVSRGVAQDAPLTVHYALSGTAVNGVDMSVLSGAVTIPAGAATADIVVTPLFNRNYRIRATDTVTLTLAAGGYVSGSPDEGTVTINNWQPTAAGGLDVPRNFVSSSDAPLTGSEVLTKTGAGNLYVGGSEGNTFSGDIVVDADGGQLRIGAIPGAATGIGVTLPGMTADNTITVRRGGNFQIEDNANGSVSSAPNRFGTEGDRPSVALEGGTLTLNGASYNAMVPQTFSSLALGPGYSVVNAIRNSGVPELVFSNMAQEKGSHVNFTSSSGTAMGTTATNAPHVRFTTPPAMTGGGGAAGSTTVNIVPGARYGSDWVTHEESTGIRALTSSEYNVAAGNDVNPAGATENVKITGTSPATFPTLSADKTLNSLSINVAASVNWTPTNKLTLTSGQLISGVQNQQMVINYPSTLTAGSGASDARLDVSVFNNNTYIRSRIEDNGSGKVTLTKNGGGTLILDGSADSTYSGGTYVNDGYLNTGSTANRRYLGSGPAWANASRLVVNQSGATANADGYDYTAVNGGQIGVNTVPYTSADTFYIGAGCVVYGSWVPGQGLNSLDRGLGVANPTPNITLDPDAIIAHSFTLAGPLDLNYNTVKNLGTDADLYYGLVNEQNIAAGSITIGTNTAFKGIATDRSDRRWTVGTIYVTPGTEEIYLQGMVRPGTTPCQLYLGNWAYAGGPIVAPSGPLTANVLGTLILDDNDAVYGDTSSGKPVTFAVKSGATINANKENAMGIGNGIASIRVDDGGSLQMGVPTALNGSVTVEAGGRLNANNSGGMAGAGTITMHSGSILELSSATGLTGPQANALMGALPPGQIIRLTTGSFGTPEDPLDAHVGGKAPIYELFYGNNGPVNPLTPGTAVMTLNRDAGTGLGGMLVNDYAGRTLPSAVNGVMVIGANGGTIAATSNTTFEIQQRIALGANALTIGATNMIDRIQLPKLGTVYLNAALGFNTAEAGSSINVIPGATLRNSGNAIPDQTDLTVDGAMLVGGSDAVGSLAGTGLVNLQSYSLTVGGSGQDSTFSGTLTNTSVSATLFKTGAGRMDITSPQDAYSGQFTVNNGILAFSGGGTLANSSLTAFTLYDSGTLFLDNSTENILNRLTGYAPCVTFNGGTFRFAGKSGEASGESLGAAILAAGAATIDVANGAGAGSSVDLTFGGLAPGFGTVAFTASNGTLGEAGDNPRVFFSGLADGLMPYATVGAAPAYYSQATGVRAFTLAEGTEFNGTVDQTGLDTKYTAANLHQPLDAARTVSSLWIDNPGASCAVDLGSSGANSLTLTSGRILLSGADDFAITRSGSSSGTLTRDGIGTMFLGIESGRTLTVGVPLSGSGVNVEKDGGGTLVLGAGNTFSGSLTVNGGMVRYAAGGAGDLAGNTVTLGNGSVLDFAGDTDSLGTLTVSGGGVTNSAAGGALTVSSLTMGGETAGETSYVQTGDGSLKLSGNVTFSTLNNPGTATLGGNLSLNGGTRTFTVNNSPVSQADVDMEISAVVSGSAGNGLTKSGNGVLKLSGANTFDGNVAAADSCGSIILAHQLALGTPTVGRTISIGNNDSLVLDGVVDFPVNYTNLFLNGAGDWQVGTVRGAIMNKSGNHTVPCPVILTGNNVYLASLAAGDKLTLAGNVSGSLNLTVNGDGDTEFGGAITTGAKTLTKNGTGMLTLSGTSANTYSSTTYLNAGTTVVSKANGTAAVNAIANGGLNIASGAALRYAASSSNPDMMGTGQINVYGTGYLDFNGASDTVGLLYVNAPGATEDTTPVRNTAGGGNVTVNGLSIQVANGYTTLIDTGTGMLTLNNNLTFYSASTGRARISGKLSLGSATRSLSTAQGYYDYDLAIDAVISGAAGVGIVKDSTVYSWGTSTGGILRFEGTNTFDGNVTMPDSNKGTLVLANNQALGVPSTARTVSVGSGDTLALDGGITVADPSDRIGVTLKGTGDWRMAKLSGTATAQSGALFSMTGTNTLPCKITLAASSQIASSDRMVLRGQLNGATYALTVAGPGETAFAGPNGMITNASSVTLISNATLALENTAAANKADRLVNTIPLTLNGGGIRFAHDSGAANFSETVGAVTLASGTNTIAASQAANGQTSALTLTSLATTGGTVNFAGTGLGDSDRNRIFINGQADGMIGPWATINGGAPAMYSAARGVYAGSGAETGIAARGNVSNAVIPDDATVSAVINEAGDSGPITLAAPWVNSVLEVRQEWGADAAVVAMFDGVTNKTLRTSRLMIAEDKAALTLGQAENDGVLMALGAGGSLSLDNRSTGEVLTVHAAIANNGSASSLIKYGAGKVLITGSNTYSGATSIGEGTLEFGGDSKHRLPGALSGSGTLAKSGTNELHLLGANSAFTGPMVISAGIVRPDQNSAFGSTVSGVTIADGATLDLGCDTTVGGTKGASQLYLNREEFTVSGTGANGDGAIVNNGGQDQLNAINRIYLAGDTTFGGKKRWDIRNDSPFLFFNDHTLTKTGVNEFAIIAPVFPGSGHMVVNQGLVRFESGAIINGNADNTATVNKGCILEIYNLLPSIPEWSLILNDGAYFRGSGTVNTTNYNHWSGPVTLNGSAFLNGNASVSWSLDGTVSGTGSLIKAGNSSATLWLNNTNNTYSGNTVVSNGFLYAKYPGSLPGYDSGRLTVANNGILALYPTNGSFGFTGEQIRDLCATSVLTVATAGLGIDTSMGDFDYGYDLARGPMALVKQGPNRLTLSGVHNTYGGYTYLYGGSLRFSATDATNDFGKMYIGYGSTNPAAVIQEGGYVSCAALTNGSETLVVGSGGTGSYGYYRKNGGTLTTGWLSVPGNNGYNAVFEQFAGDTYVVGSGSWLIMGWVNVNNSASAINLYGGTLRNPASNELSMNHNASRNSYNTISLLGPTAVLDTSAGGRSLRLATAGTNMAAIVNLNGGTLTANRVYAGNTTTPSILNLNGGTLKAASSRVDYLAGLTAATVYPGGASFDTAGFDVTVAQPLLAPVGYGLSDVPLQNGGAGYIGAPVVVVTGGSGTGATAIAAVDLTDDSPTKGTVTGITVTSPGFGYQPSDVLSVALSGGGPLAPAALGTCLLGPNDVSGGLTKLGNGMLTLAATNTYGGATIISNGVLQLAFAEALPTGSVLRVDGGALNLGGNTVTNSLLAVTDGAVVNGQLVCDSVVKTGSGLWTLGTSIASVNPIVVAEGTLKLQSAVPGLYEGTLSGSFNTAENFSACSNVAVQLGTRMANTNAKPPWGDYATFVYTGYIWNRTGTNATWTFAESIDDSTLLKIDGTTVINGGSGWNVPATGSITLEPGAHLFEARFGNGSGGAGLVYNTTGTGNGMWWTNSTFGFGIDFQGHTNTNEPGYVTYFVPCTDPGDGSLLSCTAASSGSSNLIDVATAMVLGEGTLLDLDGYVQTLSSLSGSGTVTNGTLLITGDIEPGGTNTIGTLTLAAGAALGSGALQIEVTSGGDCDTLVAGGNIDLSNLDLVIANPEALNRSKVYTIVTCSGERTGTFKSVTVPDSRWHAVYRTDGSVQLLFAGGTLIRLR